jgi:flagellar biosynthesis protein FliP
MSSNESSDYARWIELANDPSQSEEARRHYRTLMEAYVQKRLREAFQLAAKQTPEGSQTVGRGSP